MEVEEMEVEEMHIETKLSVVEFSWVSGGNVSCGFKLKPLMPSSKPECSLRCQPQCTQMQKGQIQKHKNPE